MTDFSAISAVPNGAQHLRFVEVLDRLLDRGIVVRGELWLTVADVELVFIGADLVIASAERMRAPLEREETTG